MTDEDLFLLYKNLLHRLVVTSYLDELVESELVEFNFKDQLLQKGSMYFGFDFHEMQVSPKLR